MGGGYKEDPADKAARFRERRITNLARNEAAQDTASGLSSDIRAVYGMKGLIPVIGSADATGKKKFGMFSGGQGGAPSGTRRSDNENQWGT